MAVLNKIRQRSVFLISIIALALFSFVLSDLFRNSDAFNAQSQDVIATINGKEVKRASFMRQVENVQKQMGPNSSSNQAMNRVWSQEKRTAILENEYESLGLTVERDQMREILKTNFASYEEFKDESGNFSEAKLNAFIANLKAIAPERAALGNFQIGYADWNENEKAVSKNALQQDYYNLVKSAAVGTVFEAKNDYNEENALVDIKYVSVPYTTIADSLVDVSKNEIKAYINDNKSEFEVEASRDLEFVEFREIATLEDEKNIQNELKSLLNDKVEYNEVIKTNDTVLGFNATKNHKNFVNSNSDVKFTDVFLFKNSVNKVFQDDIFGLEVNNNFGPYRDGDFYKLTKVIEETRLPDSAKVRHILVPFVGASSADASVTRTEDEAKKFSDSLLVELKSDLNKFPDFVEKFSSDKGSIANKGEYDFHPYNTMVPEFNAFEFEGKVGDLDVVKTVFGFHIIEVLGQTEKKRALKLATLARKIEPSEKTIDAVFNSASQFELDLKSKDFETASKDSKYTARPVSGVKVLDETIPGVGSQRSIVRWAFKEDVKVGDFKRFSIPGKGYVVVAVKTINEEGLSSVEQASAKVLPILRNKKKAEMIKSKITDASSLEVVSKSQNQSIRTASAVNMKNSTLSGAGKEPLVIGNAFALNEGETSELIEGNKGIYIVSVTKKESASDLDNYQSILNRLGNRSKGASVSKAYKALEDKAEIEDNRSNFF